MEAKTGRHLKDFGGDGPTIGLELTYSEAIAIESETSGENSSICPEAFLLKIGELILSIGGSREFTEEELWLIRRLVNIRNRDGGETTGLTIKRKVYQALGDLALKQEFNLKVGNKDPEWNRSKTDGNRNQDDSS
uniref:Uncharacterized protein n=1 Tax=viral metagenome TaxID=1070528 RepID=A0A6M3Y378_9ZZZZ